jgi:hypothetical protein
MQSIGGCQTSSQQHQFQEPSQPQHSRTHKLYFQGPSCAGSPQSDPESIARAGARRCGLRATLKKNYEAAALGTSANPYKCGQPLLLRHRVVEFSVVEQQTTLRRNAGDVLITMLPADIARIIDVTRIKLLGGVVIDAADIEN